MNVYKVKHTIGNNYQLLKEIYTTDKKSLCKIIQDYINKTKDNTKYTNIDKWNEMQHRYSQLKQVITLNNATNQEISECKKLEKEISDIYKLHTTGFRLRGTDPNSFLFIGYKSFNSTFYIADYSWSCQLITISKKFT